MILPTVNIQAMRLALSEFARDVGAGADKQIVLVVAQAGWHTREQVAIPDELTFVPLPAQTRELQPAERRWPLVCGKASPTRSSQMWMRCAIGWLTAACSCGWRPIKSVTSQTTIGWPPTKKELSATILHGGPSG